MNFFRFLTTRTFLIQLLIAVGITVLLVFLMMWWLRITTNHNQKVEVPDLSHMTLDMVEKKLNELDLRYEVLDSANYNPDFPKYSVIEQIPSAGKYVKENRKLYLTLNPSGYHDIEVPNVLGRTLRQAEPTLIAMGFQIGKISYQPHISDNVLEMRYRGGLLKPGTEIPKTSIIDLVVGDQSLNRLINEGEEQNIQEQTEEYHGEF
ncbi:MAG TPA: PASTA domain-containing protein [Flavobacteriaceae bacterium]|nr:PASTA domain-containing protein [Flavobacteriaceae bacterium]